MNSIFLINTPYISIPDQDSFSYGGSQQWFSRTGLFGTDARLSRFGCGNIALSDICLYLTRKLHLSTPETSEAESSNHPISKQTYLNYARMMNRRYTFTLPFCGCTGFSLSMSLNHFFLRRRLPYRAHYMLFNTQKRMLSAIQTSLSQDIPIILAIGPNFPNFRGKHGITFYTSSHQKTPEKNISFLPSANHQVHAHYVTITGLLYISPSCPMLSISSWGKQYYISYRELRNYITKYGTPLTSSIIYIRPLRRNTAKKSISERSK